MNCLEKYRSKLIAEINRDLAIIVDTPGEEPIHDFRVGVKRLTALYYFLNEIDPGLNAKQLLRPYRLPFKSIGNIRDVHIAVKLIESLEEISPQDAKLLIRQLNSNARRDYRLFQKNIPADHRLSIRVPTIRSSGISARAIGRHKPIVLNQLLSQILASAGKMDDRQWHRKRILLKRYHHVLDAFCFCPGHALDETDRARPGIDDHAKTGQAAAGSGKDLPEEICTLAPAPMNSKASGYCQRNATTAILPRIAKPQRKKHAPADRHMA
jgi:hypothetical protein